MSDEYDKIRKIVERGGSRKKEGKPIIYARSLTDKLGIVFAVFVVSKVLGGSKSARKGGKHFKLTTLQTAGLSLGIN